jgi:hypothetical protein
MDVQVKKEICRPKQSTATRCLVDMQTMDVHDKKGDEFLVGFMPALAGFMLLAHWNH